MQKHFTKNVKWYCYSHCQHKNQIHINGYNYPYIYRYVLKVHVMCLAYI